MNSRSEALKTNFWMLINEVKQKMSPVSIKIVIFTMHLHK